MAIKVNLLPQDYVLSGSVTSILKILRPLNVILLSVFIVVAIGMSAYFIYGSFVIKDLTSIKLSLEAEVGSLETAQQQLVLLKDRLAKTRQILSLPSPKENLNLATAVVAGYAPTGEVVEVNSDLKRTYILINFTDSSSLKDFIKNLSGQDGFSSIVLESFRYSAEGGYLVGVNFNSAVK